MIKVSITLIMLWEREGFMPRADRKERPRAWKRDTIRKFCKDKRIVNAFV